MYVLKAATMIILGYLSGAVSYAIIVARLVAGDDIRTLGNRNAGTMNVARSVGKGWGVPVGIMDGLKALLPMLLARELWFPEVEAVDFFIVLAVGLAAIVGHWRPLFHGFRGGRSVGCVMGVYLFIVPFEFVIAFVLGGLIVILFLKNVQYKYGQWTPIMFIIITPILTLALNSVINLEVSARYSFGGHPPFVIVGVFIVSVAMLAINISFMGHRMGELQGKETDDS